MIPQRSLLILALSLICAVTLRAEVKTYVIGDDPPEGPGSWRSFGTYEGIDDTMEPGWILPRRIGREVNLLNELYRQDRLFPFERPVDPAYKPRDGRIWSPNLPFSENSGLLRLADGLNDSLSFTYFNRLGSNSGVSIFVDLGAPFPVDEVRFYPLPFGPHQELYLRSYELYANDGSPETLDGQGNPIYHLLDAVPENSDVIVVDTEFPPQFVRYLRLRSTSPEPFEIDQLELRGSGYIPEATYLSYVIDLGDGGHVGRLSWSAEEDPESDVTIQTRTGNDRTVLQYFRVDELGREVELVGLTDEENHLAWLALPSSTRGRGDMDDEKNWSPWSLPYMASDAPVLVEVPDQYLQIRIRLNTTHPLARAKIDRIVFDYAVGGEQLTVDSVAISPPAPPSAGRDCAQKKGDLQLTNPSSLALIAEPDICFELAGSLYVSGSGFTDVEPLRGLRKVGGDVVVRNNEVTTLAGLRGLEQVGGEVSISGMSRLATLDGLERLTSVGGKLAIWDNSGLTSIAGLEGLSRVGGIEIINNQALTEVALLPHLAHIDGDLTISGNPVLENVDGLSALTEVQWGLRLRNNYALQSLAGLIGLARVGGNLWVEGNPLLTDLDGLRSLSAVGGGIIVSGNNALDDLGGLSHLTNIESLVVSSEALSDLSGLGSLERVGFLNVSWTPKLRDLNGLASLRELGGVFLLRNPSLIDLTALHRVQDLPKGLEIRDCDGLADLSGLDSLRSAGGVVLEGNDGLTNLAALQALADVTGDLTVTSNPALATLAGLGGLRAVAGSVRVSGNAALANLHGLEGLAHVRGGLEILDNASLESLAGLESLVEVGRVERPLVLGPGLYLGGNPMLRDVDGLLRLRRIGGDLTISGNESLGNLSGLAHLQTVGGAASNARLSLVDNPRLPSRIAQFLAERLAHLGFAGETEVRGNQPDPELTVAMEKAPDELRLLTELRLGDGVSLDLSLAPLVSTTPVLDLDSTQLDSVYAIRQVTWVADTPSGTRIGVRTRTGASVDTVLQYFTSSGREVTKRNYESLAPFMLGEIVSTQVVGSDWSDWSDWIWRSGGPFGSPTPRRYLQAQVLLASDDSAVVPLLHSVTFSADVVATAVAASTTALPGPLALDSYPNPFNNSALIAFSLPQAGQVILEVYDVSGQRVAVLLDALAQAGPHVVLWDGCDAEHQPVASGVYLCILRTREQVRDRKLALVR